MKKRCSHGNTMGLHGQVVCVWCGAVVRQMTPTERAADTTFRDVVDPWAQDKVRAVLQPKDKS